MGNPDFYTKVANKFGGYRSGAQRITEYSGQNPDFDPKRDQAYVERYVRNFQTAKGVQLPRHILVSVAKKV